jgi:hypothetical protein
MKVRVATDESQATYSVSMGVPNSGVALICVVAAALEQFLFLTSAVSRACAVRSLSDDGGLDADERA